MFQKVNLLIFLYSLGFVGRRKRQSTITMIRSCSDCARLDGINIEGYIDIGIKIYLNFKNLMIQILVIFSFRSLSKKFNRIYCSISITSIDLKYTYRIKSVILELIITNRYLVKLESIKKFPLEKLKSKLEQLLRIRK